MTYLTIGRGEDDLPFTYGEEGIDEGVSHFMFPHENSCFGIECIE